MEEEKNILEQYLFIYVDEGVRLPKNIKAFGLLDAISRFYQDKGFLKIEEVKLLK